MVYDYCCRHVCINDRNDIWKIIRKAVSENTDYKIFQRYGPLVPPPPPFSYASAV